jgi:hypothetical protein
MTLESIVQETCRKSLSQQLGVDLTVKQMHDYCDAMNKLEHEQEIEAAIELLKANGYTVKK